MTGSRGALRLATPAAPCCACGHAYTYCGAPGGAIGMPAIQLAPGLGSGPGLDAPLPDAGGALAAAAAAATAASALAGPLAGTVPGPSGCPSSEAVESRSRWKRGLRGGGQGLPAAISRWNAASIWLSTSLRVAALLPLAAAAGSCRWPGPASGPGRLELCHPRPPPRRPAPDRPRRPLPASPPTSPRPSKDSDRPRAHDSRFKFEAAAPANSTKSSSESRLASSCS